MADVLTGRPPLGVGIEIVGRKGRFAIGVVANPAERVIHVEEDAPLREAIVPSDRQAIGLGSPGRFELRHRANRRLGPVAELVRRIDVDRADLTASAQHLIGRLHTEVLRELPLDAKTDAEITLLACLITLTPGTLSLDLAADRSVLYIHIMYIDHNDIEAARRTIKEGYERRVLEVLR